MSNITGLDVFDLYYCPRCREGGTSPSFQHAPDCPSFQSSLIPFRPVPRTLKVGVKTTEPVVLFPDLVPGPP